MSQNEIIILGHSGFIGSALFEHLARNDIAVRGISSSEIDLKNPASVHHLRTTLLPSSILIFSAALTRQRGDNLETMQDNIKLASNVAAVLEDCHIKKCVYLSTTDVYGQPQFLPITETTPISPQTYYAAAKFCSESILQTACRRAQTPILTLRYGGIFGPGQKNIQYGPYSFIADTLKDKNIQLWGDGQELRDLVYVKDLVEVINLLVNSETEGVFNIATGKSATFLEVAQTLQQLLPTPSQLIHRERTGVKFDQEFDIGKLKEVLPNFSFTPLSKSLKEMYDLV